MSNAEKTKKHLPLICRKIKCNVLNNNSAIYLYNKTCFIYNLPILVIILFIWLFGVSGFIIGLMIGIYEVMAILSVVFAFLGYLFASTFVKGKRYKEFSIDQIRKITCDREIVRIYLSENNQMIEMKMSPRYQATLLAEVGNSLRIDFNLNPQIEPNLLWMK